MTFNFAPWAIDGARTNAGLARLASYAAGSGQSGVIQPLDLRVSALAVPGNGVRIGSGGAIVLNHYLSNPDQSYVVSNPSEHTVLAADMPAPQPGTAYYLVCVVVGDPEYDQTGHPYMPAGVLDPAIAADFEYVRVVITPCSAGTTRFEELGYNYPAYALARLEVPANTTTITNAMITDLRQLTNARESTRLLLSQPVSSPNAVPFMGADWVTINGWQPMVKIPEWATHIDAVGRIDGIVHMDPYVAGSVAVRIENLRGASTLYEYTDDGSIGRRVNLASAWSADVSQLAGQTVVMTVETKKDAGDGYLMAYSDVTVSLDIRFSERPI